MNNANWDDIRFVLAVAKEGSFLGAAKSLGVTHATVMRRVEAFERRAGQALFQKTTAGCKLLPEATRIIEAARSVEDAVLSVETTVLGAQVKIEGSLRIGTTDTICQTLLPGVIDRLCRRHPGLEVSLLSSNVYHDLEHLSADIAVRPAPRLQDGLAGVEAGHLRFGLFGCPGGEDALIGLVGPLERSAAALWMAKHVDSDRIGHATDSFLVAREMVAAGLGRAFLPLFIGTPDRRLTQIDLPDCDICFPVWVATLSELASSVRLRTIRDALAGELARTLQGQAG